MHLPPTIAVPVSMFPIHSPYTGAPSIKLKGKSIGMFIHQWQAAESAQKSRRFCRCCMSRVHTPHADFRFRRDSRLSERTTALTFKVSPHAQSCFPPMTYRYSLLLTSPGPSPTAIHYLIPQLKQPCMVSPVDPTENECRCGSPWQASILLTGIPTTSPHYL